MIPSISLSFISKISHCHRPIDEAIYAPEFLSLYGLIGLNWLSLRFAGPGPTHCKKCLVFTRGVDIFGEIKPRALHYRTPRCAGFQ
jgi:hypothetical protein